MLSVTRIYGRNCGIKKTQLISQAIFTDFFTADQREESMLGCFSQTTTMVTA